MLFEVKRFKKEIFRGKKKNVTWKIINYLLYVCMCRMAALIESRNRNYFCGGTIIKEDKVLTGFLDKNKFR
jgi:hypothetical protein